MIGLLFGTIFAFALIGALTLGLGLVIERFLMPLAVGHAFWGRLTRFGIAALALTLLWLLLWRWLPAYPEPWGRQLANAAVIFAFCLGGAALLNLRGLRRLRAHDRSPSEVDIFA